MSTSRRRLLGFTVIAVGLAALWFVAPEIYTGSFSDLGTFLRVAALCLGLVTWAAVVGRFLPGPGPIRRLAAIGPVVAILGLVLWPYLRPPTEVDEAFPPLDTVVATDARPSDSASVGQRASTRVGEAAETASPTDVVAPEPEPTQQELPTATAAVAPEAETGPTVTATPTASATPETRVESDLRPSPSPEPTPTPEVLQDQQEGPGSPRPTAAPTETPEPVNPVPSPTPIAATPTAIPATPTATALPATPTATPVPPTATPTTQPTPAAPVELRRSSFQGLTGHRGSGSAVLYDLGASELLRFENVDIGSGPALHVYLVPGADQRGLGGAIYVAPLTAERGNQNYTIPGGVDLTAGTWTVLVWCETFTVEVANATFS